MVPSFPLLSCEPSVSVKKTLTVKKKRKKTFVKLLKNGDLEIGLSEATTGGVLYKKVFLKFLQKSQENTCFGVSFLIRLQA